MDTIVTLLRSAAEQFADKAAFRVKCNGQWQATSYREFWNMSERIAAGLQQSGFKPGDHAALLAPATPLWVTSYLGTLKAGGVIVPIDKELKINELRHVLGDCDAKVLFTTEAYLEIILEIKAELQDLRQIVILDRETGAPAEGVEAFRAVNRLMKEWRQLVQHLELPDDAVQRMEQLANEAHRLLTAPPKEKNGKKQRERRKVSDIFSPLGNLYRKLTEKGELIALSELLGDGPWQAPPSTAQDTAVILYTSGTTGRSKGAMLSHGNIVSNILAARAHFPLDESISTLSFLPINHVLEQVVGILLPLSLGGTISFAESLKKLAENLAEVKPSFLFGVPAVYQLLYARIMKKITDQPLKKLAYSLSLTRPLVARKVRQALGERTIFLSGGAALDPAIVLGMNALGIEIYQGYGITETSPIITGEFPGGARPGTVGVALRDIEIRIDQPNAEGVGEIVVKGPNVMKGYYKNPRATAAVLREGWYHTGDLGRLSADGYLTICGRVKNLIVTPNGKNVYPEEVENELVKSPYIAEAMVYGHKVAAHAEEVCAIIFPDQQALDNYAHGHKSTTPLSQEDVESLIREEIQAVGQTLADYKRIRRFTLRDDEFPKTTTRKIKRYVVEADIPAHN